MNAQSPDLVGICEVEEMGKSSVLPDCDLWSYKARKREKMPFSNLCLWKSV